jgi:DNA-directed RNA polymerase specialized sigma24 family protein
VSADSRGGRNRLARLYLAHAHQTLQIAHLLGGGGDASQRANRAFIKAVAAFRDLRNPLTFEASLHRALIKECRPPLRKRFGAHPATEGSADSLWERFERQAHRRKAALVLRYWERLSDDQVADVLGCSTGTARTLVNRALSDLHEPGAESSAARVAGEVARAFTARAEKVPAPLGPDHELLRRATLARSAVAVGAVVVLIGSAVGGFLTINGRGGSTIPPEGSAQSGPGSLAGEGLVPESTVEPLSGKVAVATGVAGGNRWHLVVQPGITDQICLTLSAGADFKSTRCDLPESTPLRAYVEPAAALQSTFVFGRVSEEVGTVELELDRQEAVPLRLLSAPRILRNRPPSRFFMAVVPEFLVPLSEHGGSDASSVIQSGLQARTTGGAPLIHVPIYLGRE